MSNVHEGGCLCGDIRYKTTADPVQTTVCYCTFCQKLTGSAFLVEPIFKRDSVVFSGTATKTYDHRSDGSGKARLRELLWPMRNHPLPRSREISGLPRPVRRDVR